MRFDAVDPLPQTPEKTFFLPPVKPDVSGIPVAGPRLASPDLLSSGVITSVATP